MQQAPRIDTESGLDVAGSFERESGDKFALYSQYVNSRKVNSGRQLGLARDYRHGAGCYLYDKKGHKYLDFEAGNAIYAIGRNHPAVAAELKELIDFAPANWVARDTPLLAAQLAQQLAKRSPGDINKALFTSTGSETVEASMKYARRLSGRCRILYLEGDFHGLTYGALSVTGMDSRTEIAGKEFGPMLPGCEALPWGDPEALESALAVGDVAALIVEPVQGATSRVLDKSYLRRARELCDEYGAFLIADEILTGLGRCGSFTVTGSSGIVPDMLLFAKALSGGYVPVGALMVRDSLHERMYENAGAFVHGSSFGENDFGMAAGLATLRVLDGERLPENAAEMGQRLLFGLRALQENFPMVADVRGEGLLVGVQLRAPKSWLQQPAAKLLEQKALLGHFFAMLLVDRHRLISAAPTRNNVLRLHPPLCVTPSEIDRCLEAVGDVLEAAQRFPDGVGVELIRKFLRGGEV